MKFSIILAPLLTLAIVQAIKLASDGIRGNFNLRSLINTYGGMPSSHTAFVTSLTTIIGYKEGFDSTLFALAVIFSLLIISDALIFRRHVSHYGQALLKLTSKLTEQEKKDLPYLDKELGHSFPQVVVGAIVGFVIAFLVNSL